MVHASTFHSSGPFAAIYVSLTLNFVRSALDDLDTYICPHLWTSDSIVFERFEADADAQFHAHMMATTRDNVYYNPKNKVWPSTAMRIVCDIGGCGAICDMEYEYMDRRLLVTVMRPFEWCTVMDEEWLAKTEPVETGH
jgi:hypothetical protein